jgi:hypothetical protein
MADAGDYRVAEEDAPAGRPLADLAKALVSLCTALTGDEVLCAVMVKLVAMRAFEGADVLVCSEIVCALAQHTFAPLHSKALQTRFTLDQPG